MDIDRFVRELPSLYNNFSTLEVKAKSWANDVVKDQWAMTTENVGQLLNFSARCLEPNEVYLEIGLLQGATLCSALYNNTARAIAVDNWVDFPPDENNESNRDVVVRRLKDTGFAERVTLHEQDYREFFSQPHDFKAGAYFYDAEHQYVGTWDGLELSIPFLADRAVIVMDDFNWSMVRDAMLDWVELHKENARMIFDLTTPINSKAWWNGLGVVAWEKQNK